MISTCAHTKTRSSTSVAVLSAKRPERRSETGDEPAGRWSLRMNAAPTTPVSTSTAKRSTMNANQPWWPSHGSVDPRSTAPIIAITIVGNRTRKPQKMAAWINPGTLRCSSLRCPRTMTASLRMRSGRSPERSAGLAALRRSTSSFTRRAKRKPAAESATASATAPIATSIGGLPLPGTSLLQLPRDRRHDLGEVADHRVVRACQDRRLRVGIDRENLLRALAAGDVLGRPTDPARDVKVGRHLGASLADLVGVRAPARARHDPRAANGGAEQLGELLQDREALGRADATAAAHDHLGLRERDAGRDRLDVLAHSQREVGIVELWLERLDRGRVCAVHRRRLHCMRGDGEQQGGALDVGFLEEAAAPADA